MANATIWDLPNYVGELFGLTPTETPLLSMVGGLTGGRVAEDVQFPFQTYDLPSPSQPAILESAVPVSAHRTRAQVTNVVQIFEYGVDLSFTKQSTPSRLSGLATLGVQPVRNEMDWQLQRKIEGAALDVNYTFWQGTYQLPVDNTTARKTRGIGAAITTNVVAAGGAYFSDTLFDQLTRAMWNSGAPFAMPAIGCQIFQKQEISGVYAYAPEDRNVGGVNITVIETDVTRFGIFLDRQAPTTVVTVLELSVMAPRFLVHPVYGAFFTRPLGLTKAADEVMLYGEIGLEYGPEQWHGEITGLAAA